MLRRPAPPPTGWARTAQSLAVFAFEVVLISLVLLRFHLAPLKAGFAALCAGLLAACALHALDYHVDRLADDHANARRLADGLRGIDGLTVKSAETNIVFVDVADGQGPALLEFLKAHGVLATGLIGLRFVTHLDVDTAGIDHALATVRRFFVEAPAAGTAAGRTGPY